MTFFVECVPRERMGGKCKRGVQMQLDGRSEGIQYPGRKELGIDRHPAGTERHRTPNTEPCSCLLINLIVSVPRDPGRRFKNSLNLYGEIGRNSLVSSKMYI